MTKIGVAIDYIGIEFKNEVNQQVENMNKRLRDCSVMTPQISFYEIEHFRSRVKKLIVKRTETWSIFENVEEAFVD